MSNGQQAKGILPDAKKIKELRKKAGKTQKGLIQNSSIELRTYQRAEQGRAVLPEMLQQIAVLLSVDTNVLRIDKTLPTNVSEVFRLQCVSRSGANRLVTELQSWSSKVEYRFRIDPCAQVAEQVAAVVEYCQALEVTHDNSRTQLSSANKIRAIGHLNDQLGLLAAEGVFTYAGEYHTWDSSSQTVGDLTWEHSGEPVEARSPTISRNIRLVFHHEETEFLSGTYSSFESRESAYRMAIAWNIREKIKPDWLQEHWVFEDDFVEAYRREFERRCEQPTDLQSWREL